MMMIMFLHRSVTGSSSLPVLFLLCRQTALCAVNEKLNGLDCSCVLLPAALVMTIYTLVGISYMRVILRGGAGKNGSTVAVRLSF